uniref:Cytochrome P450 n=1 Tax=Ditylenchus dipsaci TaxID=166011 RepID=A0A915E6D4_9BILA
MLEVDTVLETLDDDVTKDTQYLQNYHLNPLIDVAVGSVINQIAFGFRFHGENREQFFELKDIIIEQVHLLAEPLTFKKRITRLNSFFNIQIEATMQRRKKESEKTSFTEDDTYFVDAFCMKWSSNLQINRKKTSITTCIL